MNVIICRANDNNLTRAFHHCPTCSREVDMVARIETWHGITVMCCGCGNQWTGEGRRPAPQDRDTAVRSHRELWDKAVGIVDVAALLVEDVR